MYRELRLVAAIGLATAVAGVSQARADTPSFSTPSGNILCHVPGDLTSSSPEADLVCHIFSADWAPPAQEVCDLESTTTLTLSPEGAPRESIFCHGDVFWPHPTPVLSYGSTWTVLDYRCEVAQNGVTCVNQSGNGFEIARRGRTIF